MTRLTRLNRRKFLGHSLRTVGGSLAAATIIPSHVLARPGQPGANERIGIGYIGAGRRGNQLTNLPPEGRIVAAADVDLSRAQAVATKHSCRAYQDYRQLLDADDIDAVFIATPDHWHVRPAIHACLAGKDIYLEKPLSLTIREGRILVEAVRKHERVLQTGSQRRAMAGHRRGCELVRNGLAGKIHTVVIQNYPSPWQCHFAGQEVPPQLDWNAWCGMTQRVAFHPDIFIQRARPGWISLQPYSGGEMTGTGAHGFDQIQWALGMDHTGPVEVWCEGGPLEEVVYREPEGLERGNRLSSHGRRVRMRYANGVVIRLEENGPAAGGEFIGDLGKIRIGNNEFSSSPAQLALTPEAELPERLPVINDHIQDWFDSIKSRARPLADVEVGHRSAILCHLGNIARWTGRRLQWDPESETFNNDDEANSYLDRPRREGFELPEF